MESWIQKTLAPPTFEDENKNRKARLLNVMLLIVLGGIVLMMPFLLGDDENILKLV